MFDMIINGHVESIDDARTYHRGSATEPKWSVIILAHGSKKSGRGVFNHIKLTTYDAALIDKIKVGVGYDFVVSIEGTKYLPKGSIKNQKDVFNEVILIDVKK